MNIIISNFFRTGFTAVLFSSSNCPRVSFSVVEYFFAPIPLICWADVLEGHNSELRQGVRHHRAWEHVGLEGFFSDFNCFVSRWYFLFTALFNKRVSPSHPFTIAIEFFFILFLIFLFILFIYFNLMIFYPYFLTSVCVFFVAPTVLFSKSIFPPLFSRILFLHWSARSPSFRTPPRCFCPNPKPFPRSALWAGAPAGKGHPHRRQRAMCLERVPACQSPPPRLVFAKHVVFCGNLDDTILQWVPQKKGA